MFCTKYWHKSLSNLSIRKIIVIKSLFMPQEKNAVDQIYYFVAKLPKIIPIATP